MPASSTVAPLQNVPRPVPIAPLTWNSGSPQRNTDPGPRPTNALTPQNIQNIRDWVAAGGRWYVSDWSNEWLQMVFPEYQDLNGWDGSIGSADNGSYDSLADILDPGLLEWLEALPEAFVDINPLKAGRFLVTGHPIVRPEDLARIRPRHVVAMNQLVAAGEA